MAKKTKTKTKRKLSRRGKPAPKTAKQKRKTKSSTKKSLVGRVAVAAVAGARTAAVDDPLGACFWVDAAGQNHCKTTTQSACKGIPGSTFRPNKSCPGGV